MPYRDAVALKEIRYKRLTAEQKELGGLSNIQDELDS